MQMKSFVPCLCVVLFAVSAGPAYATWAEDQTQIVNGVAYTFHADSTAAIIGDISRVRAIDKATAGDIVTPTTLGGVPVTSIGPGAFWYCSNLTSIVVSEGVRNIGGYAFTGCAGITNLTIASTVGQSIEALFVGLDSLKTLTLPRCCVEGALYTGQGAYTMTPAVAAQITSVTLCGNQWTEIPEQTFASFYSLKSITIPAEVTNIESYAFAYCTNLETVTFAEPSSLRTIGEEAFTGCSKLRAISLPDSVTNIETAAFANNVSLGSVRLGTGLANMEGWGLQFSGCRGITNVAAPRLAAPLTSCFPNAYSNIVAFAFVGTWTDVPEDFFSGCRSLRAAAVPAGVTALGADAFNGCGAIDNAHLSLPASLRTIGDFAFDGCTGLTGTSFLPDGLQNIDDFAFCDCSNLVTVTMPLSVTNVGARVFSRCPKVASLQLAPTAQSLGNLFNLADPPLTNVTLFGEWRALPSSAFEGFSNLVALTIPVTVTNIGRDAFRDCTALRSLAMPYVASLALPNNYPSTYLGFTTCTSLTNFEFLGTWTEIPPYMFWNVGSLVTATLPPGIGSIGGYAFYGCSNLAAVAIGSSVTNIGEAAFLGCASLASLQIPAGVTSLGLYALQNCTGLRDLSAPPFTANSLFGDSWSTPTVRSGITNLVLVGGWQSIGNDAFSTFGSLRALQVPAGVTSVGTYPFWNCTNLVSVTFLGNAPQTANNDTYSSTPDSLVTYVNATSDGWTATADGLWQGRKINDLTYDIKIENGESTVVLLRKKAMTSLTLADTFFGWPTVAIVSNAFFRSALAEATIPASVTNIGDGAFGACPYLKSATIAASAPVLGAGVFARCTALTNVTCLGDAPACVDGIYSQTPADLTTHVKKGTTGWDGTAGSTALPAAGLWRERAIVFLPASFALVNGVEVPYDWLDEYKLPAGSADTDYDTAASANGANGRPNYANYVAGLNPTNSAAEFRTFIAWKGTAPVITWSPSNLVGRVYTVEGKAALGDATWAATNAASRFFRVNVKMSE